jgi:hypothetical protein
LPFRSSWRQFGMLSGEPHYMHLCTTKSEVCTLHSERESHVSDLYRLISVGSFFGPRRTRPFRRRWFRNTGKLLSWVWPCDTSDDRISLFSSSFFQSWTILANNPCTGNLSDEFSMQDGFIYWWAWWLSAWFGYEGWYPQQVSEWSSPKSCFMLLNWRVLDSLFLKPAAMWWLLPMHSFWCCVIVALATMRRRFTSLYLVLSTNCYLALA